MAFHPAFAKNGWFYVNYTDKRGDTRVKRFTVSADPDCADPASGKQILFVAQPYANHNGGPVLFRPGRMLDVGGGAGGSGGGPPSNREKKSTLPGKQPRPPADRGA